MPTFRYDTSQTWFKGNTHIHSVLSDGGKTFEELAGIYADAGYDFLFRTDHWTVSDCAADTAAYPLLWLDGVELDGFDASGTLYHAACLGTFKDIRPENGFSAGLEAARAQGGIVILAHPYWTGNTLEDALRLDSDGVEIYNHICHGLNGKGMGRVHWEAMLQSAPETLALAVDDVHLSGDLPFWNGGWIVVNAEECSKDAVLAAIRRGNFYSSCGPGFTLIECSEQKVMIETTPVQYMRLVGPGDKGARYFSAAGEPVTSAEFEIPQDWPFMYIEIEDAERRCAWTNCLFDGRLS